MKTTNSDSIRISIFKDLIRLDKEELDEISQFIASLKKNVGEKQEKEVELSEDFLGAILTEAQREIENGEVYSTEEVMKIVDQEMGWK